MQRRSKKILVIIVKLKRKNPNFIDQERLNYFNAHALPHSYCTHIACDPGMQK